MSKEEQNVYSELNEEYKRVTGSMVRHSICAKDNLLRKAKAVVYAENN